MNSHLQIPQLILKKFRHREIEIYNGHETKLEKVYYLDLQKKIIDSEKVRLLLAVEGYYSDETEDFLNREIEGPISITINKVLESESTFTESDYHNVLDYVFYSVARSKRLLEKIENDAYLKRNNKNNRNMFLQNIKNGFFKNARISIIYNDTNIENVVPSNCVIFVNKSFDYIAPIAPKISFGIKNNGKEDKSFEIKHITDSQIIKEINKAAADVEKNNRCIIIGHDLKTLEDLAKDIGIVLKTKECDA